MKPFTTPFWRKVLPGCCVVIAAALLVRQAIITYHDTVQYGGSDLRVRIVGSRVMAAGREPYFTKWQPGMGGYLCDPNDTYDRPVNGLTVSPFLLWLQQPLARLPYPAIRLLWWGGQQALYWLSTVLLLFLYRRSGVAVIVMGLCAAALANHPAWILHCERGQYYILLTAWLAVLFALWKKKPVRIWQVALWLAFGVLMRPTLLLFGVPFLLAIRPLQQQLLLVMAGLISLITLLLLSQTSRYWPFYFSALEVYVYRAMGRLHFPYVAAPLRPALIEGATNLTHYRRDIDFEYLKPLQYYLAAQNIWPGRRLYGIVGGLLNGGLLLLTYAKNRFRLVPEQMLMLGMLLYTFTEVCQPFRASYSTVLWLPVVLAAAGYGLSGAQKTAALPT